MLGIDNRTIGHRRQSRVVGGITSSTMSALFPSSQTRIRPPLSPLCTRHSRTKPTFSALTRIIRLFFAFPAASPAEAVLRSGSGSGGGVSGRCAARDRFRTSFSFCVGRFMNFAERPIVRVRVVECVADEFNVENGVS